LRLSALDASLQQARLANARFAYYQENLRPIAEHLIQ
jgi:hypothetical protein